MMQRAFSAALAVWMVATFAGAQLSEEYKDWPDSPAGFLLTKDETKSFRKLDSDKAVKEFVELFWAKRDTDLTTAVNEFKQDFELRVEAADLQFSTDTTKGSLTDRGRALLLLGPPNAAMNADDVPSTGGQARNLSDSGAVQAWVYSRDRLPDDIKGESVYLYFSESSRGADDYHLVPGEPRNRMAMKLLAGAPERLLLHPNLTQIPRVGLVRGSKMATDEQLAAFSQEVRPWPQGSTAFATSGVMFGATTPLWLYVELPDSVAVATQLIGRVRAAEGGDEVGSFVINAQPFTVSGGRGYELTVPVKAGKWVCDVALQGDAGPLAVTTVEAETLAVPEAGTFISGFYWGVDIRQELQTVLGDPFSVGGWHVVPRPSDSYRSRDSLSYLCFVVRPPVDEEGKASAEFTMTLGVDDRVLQEMPVQKVQLSQIGGDLWMFGSNLPLRGFRRTGVYRLDLLLREPSSGVERAVTIPLNIAAVEEAPAPAAGESGEPG